MPLERRRNPVPKSEDFASPNAKKLYFATEKLLDRSPETGKLNWQDLYGYWSEVLGGFVQEGEAEDSAGHLAWGTLAFFVAEKMGDLVIDIGIGRNPLEIKSEFQVLKRANKVIGEALDGETKLYRGSFPKDLSPTLRK